MKKIAAVVMAVGLLIGFTGAAHEAGSHAGDSGVGAVSDTPNAGKTANPETTGKPEKTGVEKAVSMVPGGSVASNVLQTITSIQPGKGLGEALAGLGDFLQSPFSQETSAPNSTNDTQQ